MEREAIKKLLPHREPMQDWEAVACYTVRGDEFFLQGHFPGRPIVPGVILCEILAQSACVLLRDALEAGRLPVYTGLNNVKFRSPVRPGDRVEARCRIRRAKPPFYFAEGRVTVEGRSPPSSPLRRRRWGRDKGCFRRYW